MINQQLLEYVRAQRTAGLSKEAIIKAAAAGGWTPADLEEVFMSIDGVTKPPVTPSARVITPPPQPVAAANPAPTPIVQPVEPLTPLTPRPMVAPMEVTTAAPMQVKKRRVWPYVLSGVLVVIAGVAVALYFFVWPVISQVLAPAPADFTQSVDVGQPIPLESTLPAETSQATTSSDTASSTTASTTTTISSTNTSTTTSATSSQQ